ncbi:MAG TPA: hypothetical protein VNG29_00870 [Candidatus Paceibacterota bacterium]|nr:hypothetical protein [Candidatus Paceibacterota bacterium]
MRTINPEKEWVGVIECCGTGFDESGCGKTLLADRSDLRFDSADPGILFVVCPCGARNLVHVSEELKDKITGTTRWVEKTGNEYRLMAAKTNAPASEFPN